MLAVTPICWNHYFLWTLPAALFLIHRPRLLLTAAVLSLAITLCPPARAAGGHMIMALGLFGLVVHDVGAEAIPEEFRFEKQESPAEDGFDASSKEI